MINVKKDFGAVGDGIHDDTSAVQAAVDTGQTVYAPSSKYNVTRQIVCSTPGQTIIGDGRTKTQFVAQPGFKGVGVFVAVCGEPGPNFVNLGVTCVQPDTSNPAALNNYPPAFLLKDTPRFQLCSVRISLFQLGVDMTGNSGGAFFDTVECSAFGCGVAIDGSLDIVRFRGFHSWPFDMAGTQRMAIWDSPNCTGIYVGRCDGLFISDSMFISGGWHINATSSAKGPVFGNISNTGFDTTGAVAVVSPAVDPSHMAFSNCYWTAGVPQAAWLRMIYNSGSVLTINGCQFMDFNGQEPGPYIHSSNAAKTIIAGSYFRRPPVPTSSSPIYGDTGSKVIQTGNFFDHLGTSYVYPDVNLS